MARWFWTVGGAIAGAILAWGVMSFWIYLERSEFGTKEPVYHGYWTIAADGDLVLMSPPGALLGGIAGYLVARRMRART